MQAAPPVIGANSYQSVMLEAGAGQHFPDPEFPACTFRIMGFLYTYMRFRPLVGQPDASRHPHAGARGGLGRAEGSGAHRHAGGKVGD